MQPYVTMFGVRYLIPTRRSRSTVIVVNLGGALIPVGLSACLITNDRLGWQALAAVAIVGVLVRTCLILIVGQVRWPAEMAWPGGVPAACYWLGDGQRNGGAE